MKLAFVVQRYGADIAGGSELHCRELAQRLSARHDITVFTSCARDYVTWDNEYPSGVSADGAVRVIRFAVARPRQVSAFAQLSDEVFEGHAPREQEEEWFRENGPQVPDLLAHLREHGREYDAVLFWTFRYYPSFFGLPLVRIAPCCCRRRRTIRDPSEYHRRLLHLPAAYLFLTPEEKALVSDPARAARSNRRRLSEPASSPLAEVPSRALLRSDRTFRTTNILYLGRVDRNKGCDTLLEYFQEYASESGGANTTLVLAGPVKLQIPHHPRIRALGYVSDEMRAALLAHARLMVVPSPYESLSIALLEAWNHGIPALVNARCQVLKEQVRRANGGLYYRSFSEFSEALDYLGSHPDERQSLGAQGREFIEREYRWHTVLPRVEALLTTISTSRASVEASRAI